MLDTPPEDKLYKHLHVSNACEQFCVTMIMGGSKMSKTKYDLKAIIYPAYDTTYKLCHYIDVIMTTMASQITSLTVVYSTVYSDADQRKRQISTSLASVWGIHRDRWIPRTKGQLRGKCFHLMTSSWQYTLQYTHNHDWLISKIFVWIYVSWSMHFFMLCLVYVISFQWFAVTYLYIYIYILQISIYLKGLFHWHWANICMMTSSNGNLFRVTGHLCGEFTGPRWISRTKASDAELWCFLWSASEKTIEWTIVRLVIWDAITPIMTSLQWISSHNKNNEAGTGFLFSGSTISQSQNFSLPFTRLLRDIKRFH